jgi:hypothetical protein
VWPLDNGPYCDGLIGAKYIVENEFDQNILKSTRNVGYYGIRNHANKNTGNLCWDDEKDISIAQYHNWDMTKNSTLLKAATDCVVNNSNASTISSLSSCDAWASYLHHRAKSTKAAFYYRGKSKPGAMCSPGIRPWVHEFCPKSKHCIGLENDSGSITDTVFVLAPAGWACWSSRLYDGFQAGTIPVVMADNIVHAFEEQLPYDDLIETVITGEPTNLTGSGGPQMDRLTHLAQTWVETCRLASMKKECLEHPVSIKMNNIIRYRPFFGWGNVKHDYNAYALFERELMRETQQLAYPPQVF